MDREQGDMQFLGLFDIYVEAYKVIIKGRKIFSQFTLSLILPLSFIFLVHTEVSNQLKLKLYHDEFQLHHTQSGTSQSKRLVDHISSELATLWLFRILYFTFVLVFFLLSTSAVVYTLACIYTGCQFTFKKVMKVVPKVWKRLMITFLWAFLALFAYHFVAAVVLVALVATLGEKVVIGSPFLTILLIVYFLAFLYITIIWHLASVVSVLEDSCGIKAMMKGKELIKGKLFIALVVFSTLNFGMAAIQFLFHRYVIHEGWRFGALGRLGLGMLFLLLLLTVILFGLVIQTIIYFVCKSYHHENIDKSALSSHLEVYLLEEYEPLKARDVQLEQFEL